MSAGAIEYDDEGRPTLATTSGNRVVLAFAFLCGGVGAGKVDVCWEKYPPSAADVEECALWLETVVLPQRVRVAANVYDPL